MPRAKAPLAERDANATPKKPAAGKQDPKATKAPTASANNEKLLDVANRITKTHSKKRPHEDEDANENQSNTTADAGIDKTPPQVTADDMKDWPAEGEPFKWDCNQIRSKCRALINSGEMKVGEFQSILGVSPNSYQRFMTSNGKMGGVRSDAYSQALHYFSKREEKGLKIPRAKKAKTDKDASTSKSSSKKDSDDFDVSDIHLPNEESGSVPVFDTCDDVRNKINAHLRKPGQTMAGLGRTIAAAAMSGQGPIQGTQIKNFLQKKGPRAGATSATYYAAYVYFEKLRVKAKKPKSKKREEMEAAHGPNGADRETDASRGFLVGPGERPYEDRLGVVTFHRTGKSIR